MQYYTLIKPNGKIEVFTVKECAEIFQMAYGGVLITPQVLDTIEDSVILEA